MPCPLQNFKFLFNFPQTCLISHKLLCNRFQSDKLSSKPINSQIDLAKSPFTNNLSYLITINSGCKFYIPLYPLYQSLSSGCQILWSVFQLLIIQTFLVLNSFGLFDFWFLNMFGLVDDNLPLIIILVIWGCICESQRSYFFNAFPRPKHHVLLIFLRWMLV